MDAIKDLRTRYGLSRRQLSDAFCIPYRTVQSWELGLRVCPEYVYHMIAMLLELSDHTGGLEAFRNGVEKPVEDVE